MPSSDQFHSLKEKSLSWLFFFLNFLCTTSSSSVTSSTTTTADALSSDFPSSFSISCSPSDFSKFTMTSSFLGNYKFSFV